jgi:hypothetical protein
VINVAAAGAQPGPLYGDYASCSNPFGIPSIKPLTEALEGIGLLLVLVGLVASVVSLVLRFRRSREQNVSSSSGSFATRSV